MGEVETAPPAIGRERAYLFEAKGIQRWVLEGGKLRNIAAGSAVLAAACRSDGDDLLKAVLEASKFNPRFSRRAGGAFMLHYGDGADDAAAFARFRALWRLVFMQVAPGLEFVESFGSGDSLLTAAAAAYNVNATGHSRAAAGRENSIASLLPMGHPLLAMAPRTGRPAVAAGARGRRDPADGVISAKRRAEQNGGDDVGGKFIDPQFKDIAWPNEMDIPADKNAREEDALYFPFEKEPHWIAVMHADISALGEFYRAVRSVAHTLVQNPGSNPEKAFQQAGALAYGAAECIEQALIAAARTATAEILLPQSKKTQLKGKALRLMPARPILLGGDDVTIILRGDLALPFANRFLAELEANSKDLLTRFVADQNIPSTGIAVGLTAAAGLAFGKSKQPFFRLLDLAESLCGFAKARAKQAAPPNERPASVIAFHRVTESALSADAKELLERLKISGKRQLTAQPYRVGTCKASTLIDFDALGSLRQALAAPELKSGGLRAIRSAYQRSLDDQASESARRWREMAKKRASGGPLAMFDQVLKAALGGDDPTDYFFSSHGTTPVFDALEWEALT